MKSRNLIAGILLLLLGPMLIAGFFFHSSRGSEEQTYTAEEKVTSLELEDEKMSVTVVGGSKMRGKVQVVYPQDRYSKYDIRQRGESLVIKKKPTGKTGLFQFASGDTIQIKVGREALKDLCIHTSHGSIRVENLKLQSGKLCTTNVSIQLDKVTVKGRLSAQTSHGGIKLHQVALGEGALAASHDSILLQEVAIGEGLTVKTTHGAVTGTIKGAKDDFLIHSKTTHGKNKLGNSAGTGKKKLRVSASNSDIDIKFQR